MKEAWIHADRVEAIRVAAAGWRRALLVDDAVLAAVDLLYPAPRRLFGPVMRATIFGFSTVAAWALFAACAFPMRNGSSAAFGSIFLVLATAFALACDRLLDAPRFAVSGAAAAAATWAASFVAVGVTLVVKPTHDHDILLLVAGSAALSFALASWRWGWPLFATMAAASTLLFFAALGFGRLAFLVLALLLASATIPFLDRPTLPLARRFAAHEVLAIALAAAYLAANRWSVDARLIETFAERTTDPGRGWPLAGAILTALLPVVLLAWGLATRRRFLLLLGAVMAALSLVTLRHYVQIAPTWVVLTACGATLIAVALLLERALRRSPGKEWGDSRPSRSSTTSAGTKPWPSRPLPPPSRRPRPRQPRPPRKGASPGVAATPEAAGRASRSR